jgi:hypothetical protein
MCTHSSKHCCVILDDPIVAALVLRHVLKRSDRAILAGHSVNRTARGDLSDRRPMGTGGSGSACRGDQRTPGASTTSGGAVCFGGDHTCPDPGVAILHGCFAGQRIRRARGYEARPPTTIVPNSPESPVRSGAGEGPEQAARTTVKSIGPGHGPSCARCAIEDRPPRRRGARYQVQASRRNLDQQPGLLSSARLLYGPGVSFWGADLSQDGVIRTRRPLHRKLGYPHPAVRR